MSVLQQYTADEVCTTEQAAERWNRRVLDETGEEYQYGVSTVRHAVYRGLLTPVPRAQLPAPLSGDMRRNYFARRDVDRIVLRPRREGMKKRYPYHRVVHHACVYQLEDLCDWQEALERWNSRIHEAGFVFSYTSDVVRKHVEEETLLPVPVERLPEPLRSEHRKNWFAKEAVESVYLRPERARQPKEAGMANVFITCPRTYADGHSCGTAFRAGPRDAPWFWCRACRAGSPKGWKRWYHEHGPNSHLPVIEPRSKEEEHNG